MKFNLVKSNGRHIPATDADKKKVDKLSEGEVFSCRSISQRNYEFHKKYWALMDFAFENLPEQYDGYWVDVDDFEEEVLKAIGWRKVSKDFHGNETAKAKSISFEKCSEEKFQKIYNRALTLICRMIGVEETDIMDELMNFM